MNEVQSVLDKRRRQEAMNEIKDIFMDAFGLQPLDAKRPILEQL